MSNEQSRERRAGYDDLLHEVRIHHDRLRSLEDQVKLWASAQQEYAQMLRRHMDAEEVALTKYASLLETISAERQAGRELRQKLLQSTLSWGLIGTMTALGAIFWKGLLAKFMIFGGKP